MASPTRFLTSLLLAGSLSCLPLMLRAEDAPAPAPEKKTEKKTDKTDKKAEKTEKKGEPELDRNMLLLLKEKLPRSVADLAADMEEYKLQIEDVQAANDKRPSKSNDKKITKINELIKTEMAASKDEIEHIVKPLDAKITRADNEVDKLLKRKEEASGSQAEKLQKDIERVQDDSLSYELQRRAINAYLTVNAPKDKALPHALRGQSAPAFTGELLSHDAFSFPSKLTEGKVVIMAFVSAYNDDSIKTASFLLDNAKRVHRDELVLVIVCIGNSRDTFLNVAGHEFDDNIVVLDYQGKVGKAYSVTYVPQLTLIDHEGTVRGTYVGDASKARSGATHLATDLLKELDRDKSKKD